MGYGSRERVLDALNHRIPDKVPYIHLLINTEIRKKIAAMGGIDLHYDWEPEVNYAPIAKLDETPVMEPFLSNGPECAQVLGYDAIDMNMLPPFWVHVERGKGAIIVKDGFLTDESVVDRVHFPNPDDYMKPIEDMVKKYKGEYALGVVSRLGVSWIMNCVGLMPFSIAVYEEPEWIQALLRKYTDWVIKVIDNCQEAGIEYFKFADDLAFHSSTMFSPEIFDEIFKPFLEESTSHVKVPWIWHSDGCVTNPILDRIVALGAAGFNPIEPGCMDEPALKRDYGDKLCLVGNVDMNYYLTEASREEVFERVKSRIDLFGPGGNYIITDSNCIADYLNPQNVKWMSEAVHEYRNIY